MTASPPADQPAKETCFGLSGIALMGGLEDQPADHIGEVNEMVDLAELKRLAEAATPGPWGAFDHYCGRDPETAGQYAQSRLVGPGRFDTVAEVRQGNDDILGSVDANAAFIAAANPAAVLSLLDLIARQQETIRADGEALVAILEVSGDRAAAGFNESGRLGRINDRVRARLSAHQPKEPK
jgi:hypothetical protein